MPADTDDPSPEVPVRCEACDTETQVPLSELADALERHNEQLHDGDDAARVDPDVADQLADLVAEDLDLV